MANLLRRTPLVLAIYSALTVIMTWPLVLDIASDVPGDLGDSLLNMWILAWGAERVPRVLTGQTSLREYWDANIFHPEPLALGFSEHLFGQVLQILPWYWLTGNVILCYNLLFLSSFALSGLGAFLLARDLLEERCERTPGEGARCVLLAAFVAGVIFAFIPYRIAQVAHVQTLHSQWMPLALYGLRRYIVTGNWRALAGGAAALLMQNWSNGYYLIYFAPFVAFFVVHQMWAAGRFRSSRTWIPLVLAGVAVFAGTWPFLALYLELNRTYAFERPLAEVVQYSADVYSYLSAPEALRVWGDVMQAYPKPEGELFFGLIPWILFLAGVVAMWMLAVNRDASVTAGTRQRPVLEWALLAIIVVQTAGVIAIVFTGGFVSSIAGIPLRATNATRLMIMIAVAAIALLAVSPVARARTVAIARTPVALCVAFAVLAMWLSLGPLPQSHGEGLAGVGLYRVLYDNVPGYRGLRVPARYAMIAALFISIASAFGAALVLRKWPRHATIVGVALLLAFISEAWFAPMPVNLTWGSSFVQPPARVYPADEAPPVYRQLARLPADAVVAEFPFGDVTWELRYVYYSTVHWKRLVNGYSGGFPPGYATRVAQLQRVREDPDTAWRALRAAGTTHVVVHQSAFAPGDAAAIVKWLEDHFAVEIARFGDDLLFDVSGVWPPRL